MWNMMNVWGWNFTVWLQITQVSYLKYMHRKWNYFIWKSYYFRHDHRPSVRQLGLCPEFLRRLEGWRHSVGPPGETSNIWRQGWLGTLVQISRMRGKLYFVPLLDKKYSWQYLALNIEGLRPNHLLNKSKIISLPKDQSWHFYCFPQGKAVIKRAL